MTLFGLQLSAAAEVLDPTLLPPAYEAEYQAHRMGMGIQADVRFETHERGATYVTQLSPKGLLTLFRDDLIEERSELTQGPQGLQVENFHYRRASSDGERVTLASFDRDLGLVTGEHNGNPLSLPLNGGAVDRSALQLALIQRLRKGETEFQIRVIDLDRVVEYAFTVGSPESINTPLGGMNAVPVTRHDEDRDRSVTTWFAIDQHYVPIRLEEKRNGQRITLNIFELRWLDSDTTVP